jgi:hypothetical protein
MHMCGFYHSSGVYIVAIKSLHRLIPITGSNILPMYCYYYTAYLSTSMKSRLVFSCQCVSFEFLFVPCFCLSLFPPPYKFESEQIFSLRQE